MSPAANKPTVLIVTGEGVAARDLERQLWASGFLPVGHATTAARARVLAGDVRPDLVLMDLQTADAGDAVIPVEAIRAQFAVPVVILTAPAGDEAGSVAGLRESPACLVKPFTDRELRAVLELSLYQHRMVARLALSEQRFRTFFDAEPECVKVVNRHGELLEMNAAGLAILEADSVEEVKAHSLFKFILPEYQAAFGALHKHAIAGKAGLLEFEVVGLRGTRRWLETHAAPIANADGRVTTMLGITRDITARKLAAEQLRRNEESLAITLQSIGDAVIATDAAGAITRMNATAERLTGWTADAIGRPLDEVFRIVNAGTRAPAVNPLQRVMAGGLMVKLANDTLLLCRDGREYQIADSSAPIRDHAGRIVGMVLVFRDVTDEYRARQDLARITGLLERTGEMAKIGGWELDLRTMKLFWSQETFRIHDMDPPQVPDFEAGIDLFAPEARPIIRAAVQAAIDSGTAYDLELPKFTVKGRRIWVRTQGSAVIENGKAVKLVGAFHDITERKHAEEALRASEERFRSLTEWSPEPVAVYRDEKVIYVNPAAVKLMAATHVDELVGEPVMTLIHPDSVQAVRERLQYTLEHGVGAPLADVKLRRLDGSVLNVEIQSTPIVFDKLPAFHVAIRDVTPRKQAEAAQAALEAQLRESQKMEAIGTLAGGIAHDFNNILATILGNVDLARQDADTRPLALESLEEIRKAGARARDLVQQILSFSRRQPTERKPVVLAPIIEECARLLRATLPARLVLDVHCGTEVPVVLADATQIQQVVINLVNNAVHAMQGVPGRVGIRLDSVMLDAAMADAHAGLRALHAARPGRVARLTVSDNGAGMDAATLARVFEPFFTTKPVDEGSGLGLSVVHGIVRTHEGAIEVVSQPGKGASFTLYLPAAHKLSAAAEADQSEADSVAVELDTDQHILYLDDDESLVFLAQRMLKRRGHRVSGYIDQHEALEAIRTDPFGFDLVVTDYNMPGMSGLDVARAVRAIRPDLPVAIASGFIDETLRAQAKGAGVREVIFKANAVEDLCDAFVRLLPAMTEKSNDARGQSKSGDSRG